MLLRWNILSSVKNLGITCDERMLFQCHIENIKFVAIKEGNFIKRISKNFKSVEVFRILNLPYF